MHRHMQLLEGGQQPFDGIRQLNGRGGIGQQGGAGNQEDDADHHESRGLDASLGNVDEFPRKQSISLVDEQQIQQGGENQNRHDGSDAFDKHFHGDSGQKNGSQAEYAADGKPHRLLGHKQHHNEQGGKNDLEPGVQPVNDAFPGEILS